MKERLLKIVAGGGSIGAGGVLAYEVVALFKSQPALALRILEWGPLFGVIVLGGYLMDRRLGQFVAAQEKTAVAISQGADAQRQVAVAVEQLCQRDDERAREQDITLNFLTRNSEEILEKLRNIEMRLPRS